MGSRVSIAIETSCRAGGVALGRDEEMIGAVDFDASRRHAAVLVGHLDELLRRAETLPGELAELYVSTGPGSFTGLRVGITVARTLALAVPGLRCVAVPTARAVAENARDLEWQHLAVVMDATEGRVYAALFDRRGEQIVQAAEPVVATPQELLAHAPRPLMLIGEGLAYHRLSGQAVARADPSLHLPTAEGVWRVGRRLARAGQFTPANRLLPIYTRPPKAVRLWEDSRRSGR